MRKNTLIITFSLAILIIMAGASIAQSLAAIDLPVPDKNGGKPLMQALSERQTTRTYNDRDLSTQQLSNLLWAAFGINRDNGRRTAPSAMNWQEVEVYVAMKKGCYRYDPKAHRLEPVLAEDIRAATGQQDYVDDAALNLVYVADLSKMGNGEKAGKITLANADTGFIGQNVYLYCASEGLATVVRGLVDREALSKILNLGPEQHITLAQTVGYPAE